MHRFFAATGRFAVRFRWAVVAAWLAATVAAHLFLPSLASVPAVGGGLLPASSPSSQAARLAAPFQGSQQVPVPVVIARGGGRLTAADTLAVGRLATSLAGVTGVAQVKELGVSRDGQAAQLLVLSSVDASASGPVNRLVTSLRDRMRSPTPVWRDPAPMAAAERRLASLPQVGNLAGPLDVNGAAVAPGQLTALHARLGAPRSLPALPPPGSRVSAATWARYRAENQFISPDGRTVLFDISLSAGGADSNAALHQVPAVRAAVAAVAHQVGASASGVTGDAPVLYDVSRASDRDLLRIFPVAIAAIAILLALVLRSLVAPVYLIASVALSYLAAFGLSVLLFQDATGAGGLSYFVPFLMFLFLLALGEDYNILVMTRIREEAADVPLRQAVTSALARTGSTVSSAGLVLAGTFGVFALVAARQPGGTVYTDILASLAIGILMDAFLVRTLLVPATVALLGRWNWWPSRHGAPAGAAPAPSVTPVGIR